MRRIAILVCGIFAYLTFQISFLYLFAFMAGFAVPKTVDSGQAGPLAPAIIVNTMLLAMFAVQHGVMARDTFKSWLTKWVPEPLERSVFVVAASSVLGLVYWLWQPIPAVLWDIQLPWLRGVLWFVFFASLLLVLYTSFLIDHFDLFGLRQVWLSFRGQPYAPPPFSARSLYKYVRHPMMLGLLMAFWSVSTMTWGHALFSALMTGYIVVGIHMEERSLVRKLGEDYCRYRKGTSMLLPWFPDRGRGAAEHETSGVPIERGTT
jgi:protein-S-isoprenylcysteine O-methyltransferase Ste14